MYEQIKKLSSHSVTQKKGKSNKQPELLDNRSGSTIQQKTLNNIQDSSDKKISQLKQDGTIQLWPYKDWYVPGPGKGFIPFMGAQYDPKYRTKAHHDLLSEIPKNQSVIKTFMQENHHASQYPYAGSKSVLGDAGITAHKAFAFSKRNRRLALPLMFGLGAYGYYNSRNKKI